MICATGLEWKCRVLQKQKCLLSVVRGHVCEGPTQAHHVITQQQLRKRGLLKYRWAVANGVPVCEKAHTRHTGAVERLPRALLPPETVSFAEELGLVHLIERYYQD